MPTFTVKLPDSPISKTAGKRLSTILHGLPRSPQEQRSGEQSRGVRSTAIWKARCSRGYD
jgi:hypothetical protein